MSKKKGLGRGLDALLGEVPAAPDRQIAIEQLKPNRRQPRRRFDEVELSELAESIRLQGMVQPIVVTLGEDKSYTIVAGERRWRAARLAGLQEVPIVVRQVADERELLELALVENLQRSDLNPMEEAEAFQVLRQDHHLSQEELAVRVGKSRPAVANALRLLNLPEEVQDLLRDGRLSAGQARPLLSLGVAEEQIALARRAVSEGLSARSLERAVSEPKPELSPKKEAPKKDVHTAAAEESLTQRLQTRVEIRRRKKSGEVRIHFHGEEELMRIYDLLVERGANR